MNLLKICLLSFVFFSSYSHRVIGRASFCDFLSLAAIILFIISFKKLKIPPIIISVIFLFVTFSFGILVTHNILNTSGELLAHFFLFLSFILMINVFKSFKDFRRLVVFFALSTLISALIGIYDLSTIVTGLPELIGKGYHLRLPSGTFRNGGQAGAYMLVAFAVLYAIYNSKIKSYFGKKELLLFFVTMIISVLYLFLNAKIAGLIGLVFGLIIYIIVKRKLKSIIPVLIFLVLGLFVFNYLKVTNNRIYNRFIYKFNTRIKNNLTAEENTAKEMDWMEGNYGAALKTFIKYPIAGSGIGGFYGVFHRNEVHSTPLKIIGETGLLGIIGYSLFMICVFLLFANKRKYKDDIFMDFLSHLFPLFLGCILSWGYTYHLRKREFWIMLTIIFLAKMLSKKYLKARNNGQFRKASQIYYGL